MSKLTKSSEGKICIRCERIGAYSCHYNGPRQHDYGKGRGIKANDLMTAEFCMLCDSDFSEGSIGVWINKWERSEEFNHWINMTNIRRLKDGDIKI